MEQPSGRTELAHERKDGRTTNVNASGIGKRRLFWEREGGNRKIVQFSTKWSLTGCTIGVFDLLPQHYAMLKA